MGIKLTPTENRVLAQLVIFGCDKLVAREMGISPRTVEIHIRHARVKMGAANRVLLALAWDRKQREGSNDAK